MYDVEAHCRALVDAGLPCMGSAKGQPRFSRELTAEEDRLLQKLMSGYDPLPPLADTKPEAVRLNRKPKPVKKRKT
jgi:hypothetical protein